MKLSSLMNCSLGDELPVEYSSVDLAVINHSLARRVTEKFMNNSINLNANQDAVQSQCFDEGAKGRQTLSLGQKRAVKVIMNFCYSMLRAQLL